jgi:protein-S-isoprenylcysteine O-methyltransferase Ste14
MTTSSSTPRLRITLGWYLIVLLFVAVSERPWTLHWSGQAASIAGLLLMAGAALGRLWTSAFIAGSKDERLVTTGPYSLCRHPLYALSIVGGTGVGLASRSAAILVLTLALLLSLHLRAIRHEESMLAARFPDDFRRYRETVPRLIPRGLRASAPPEVRINVALYRKAFLDAGSFIVLYAALAALDGLHAARVVPSLIVLW